MRRGVVAVAAVSILAGLITAGDPRRVLPERALGWRRLARSERDAVTVTAGVATVGINESL